MKTRTWILIFAVILAICVGASFYLLTPGDISTQAEILRQGKGFGQTDESKQMVGDELLQFLLISVADG